MINCATQINNKKNDHRNLINYNLLLNVVGGASN